QSSYSTLWLTGDFNGDGRTDIAAPRPCSTSTNELCLLIFYSQSGQSHHSFTVQTAGGFAPILLQGTVASDGTFDWQDSGTFVTGDFNGDGRTDIVYAWNDPNNGCTYVGGCRHFDVFVPQGVSPVLQPAGTGISFYKAFSQTFNEPWYDGTS